LGSDGLFTAQLAAELEQPADVVPEFAYACIDQGADVVPGTARTKLPSCWLHCGQQPASELADYRERTCTTC